jgi:RsiW-degrading membrane proteinase PrsW (M82 family)
VEVSDEPRERLFQLNAVIGISIVYLTLGTVLVVTAASALGRTASTALRPRREWLLLLPFGPCVLAGQFLAENPELAPWLFPFLNVAIVSIPSLVIALTAARRYASAHPLAWPVSKREWTSAFAYGAIGATTVAAVINTACLLVAGIILVQLVGEGSPWREFESGLRSLPRGWGIFLDVSLLSAVAPLNEETWKGLIVALFFFRRGGAARCFLWGVLAGAGFNLLETFLNSLTAVSPEALADSTIGSAWWFFALARAGTGAIHAAATGLAALGFYGLFRRRHRYLAGLVAGPALHGSWNFLTYAIWGDAMFTGAGPDSRLLDVLGGVGLVAVFVLAVAILWTFSGGLRDEGPAPIYRLLGMRPAAAGRAVTTVGGDRTSANSWAIADQQASTGGSGPGGTLTASARASTEKRAGVSPA